MVANKIYIGSDHAGFEVKAKLIQYLTKKGVAVTDHGAYSSEAVDYPDFAHKVASSVSEDETSFGILICGSGNGVCMTANKHAKIRAGLAWETELAKLTRLHNNANVLCMPARFVSYRKMINMVNAFLTTEFEGGRHLRRVNKIHC